MRSGVWSGVWGEEGGMGRHTDEAFLGVESLREVGYGDVSVEGNQIECFPVHEQVTCCDVGELVMVSFRFRG